MSTQKEEALLVSKSVKQFMKINMQVVVNVPGRELSAKVKATTSRKWPRHGTKIGIHLPEVNMEEMAEAWYHGGYPLAGGQHLNTEQDGQQICAAEPARPSSSKR